SAIAYIDEYFMTRIDFDSLAASSGYSTDYFRILFKKYTDTTPKQYVINKLVEYAKVQLKQKDIALSVIATNCGFNYYSAFSSFFKLETGLSPLKYRSLN